MQTQASSRRTPPRWAVARSRVCIHIHTRKTETKRLIGTSGVDLPGQRMSPTGDVTALLDAWREGNQAAHAELMDLVYEELKRLAKVYLRREDAGCSVAPTALVHEAYFKLVDQRRTHWRNRHHFFGIAAQAMRRILVDRARGKRAEKRGGRQQRVAPPEDAAARQAFDVDILALDAALSRLGTFEPRWSRLVELRFFAGLNTQDTAVVLGVSPGTVKRDWSLARAWLHRELGGEPR
jgi:RNA polymerase sigma factor (TIGR02999 family)